MEAGSVDAVVTDPPYGCGKEDWDSDFPTGWYLLSRNIAKSVYIITGSSGLYDSVPLVGNDFIDVISARNLNGMTRGPIGFGNWIACVAAGKKCRTGVNFFEFCVRGDMPDHPSPKPIEYMLKLIERVTEPCDTVFDPFMGSGTTGVACMQLGRNFIGCEKVAKYYAIAEKRISEAASQLTMF
jgi:DNA modification methylase